MSMPGIAMVALLAVVTDATAVEGASVGAMEAFEVAAARRGYDDAVPLEPPIRPQASISAPRSAPIGSGIEVDWSGPGGERDFLQIAKPDVPDPEAEIARVWLDRGSPVTVGVPGAPGAYEIRYVWAGPDGPHVLARAPLIVTGREAMLIAPASVRVGQSFWVEWEGPGAGRDYVDLVRAGHVETAGELAWAFVGNGSPVVIRAPRRAGNYTLRYVLEAGDGRHVLAETPLEVTEAVASVAFEPDVTGGSTISVEFSGPAGSGDYVDLVPEGHSDAGGGIAYFYVEEAADGATGELLAPGKPGRYAIRYVMEASDGRRVLAAGTLTVTAPMATLDAPDAVDRGTTFLVAWKGPNADRDYVDLAPAGTKDAFGDVAYAQTRGEGEAASAGTVEIEAPGTPGEYELRYILDASDGTTVLARRPLVVR